MSMHADKSKLNRPNNSLPWETPEDDLYVGGFNHRDEANALIAMAVRNGPIENLHAGRTSPLYPIRA